MFPKLSNFYFFLVLHRIFDLKHEWWRGPTNAESRKLLLSEGIFMLEISKELCNDRRMMKKGVKNMNSKRDTNEKAFRTWHLEKKLN